MFLLRMLRNLKQARKAKRINAWLADYSSALKQPDARARFDEIYKNQLWSRIGKTRETESGVGSTLKATKLFREELERFLTTLPPGLLFDAPCGDLNFMRRVQLPKGWSYLGADIVSDLVDDLRRRFPDREFIQFDLTSDPFPAADVWLCRACLFHLSYADIIKALSNFVRSSVPLAMLTSHLCDDNRDIVTGDFRELNLMRPPFNFQRPSVQLRDEPYGSMGVWRREEIADFLARYDTSVGVSAPVAGS